MKNDLPYNYRIHISIIITTLYISLIHKPLNKLLIPDTDT